MIQIPPIQTFEEFEAEALALLTPPRETRFGRISFGEIRHRKIKPLDYVIDGWMVGREQSFIAGESQSGKSFLATHAGLCIATGRPFFGSRVAQGLVIYQAGESGTGVVDLRIPAWIKHFGHDLPDTVPFEILSSRVDLFRPDGDVKALIEAIRAITAEYGDIPLRAVFIDTLSKAMSGANENDGRDISRVLTNVEMISRETGAHVCVVHHLPKNGTGMRGHGSLKGDVDSVAMVRLDEVTKIRTMSFDKMKDGPKGGTVRFELMSVEIGRDDIDRPITSCVCLPVGDKEQIKADQQKRGWSPNPTERRVLTAMFEAIKRHGRLSGTELEEAHKIKPGTEVVEWSAYRDVARSMALDDGAEERSSEAIRKEFERARDALFNAGVLGVAKPYLWWAGRPVKGFGHTFPKPDEARTPAGQEADKVLSGLPENFKW